MNRQKRLKPNILITGTPGVGKSTIAEKLCELTGLNWVNIGKIAEEHNCLQEYDEEYECPVIDEDAVIDALEDQMTAGGNVVDYHGSDFFPKRWFDIVFVLRTETSQLYDRLSERGYSKKKLDDNMQCEIFQMMLEEAKESYDEDIVHELKSNSMEDFEENLKNIKSWIEQWVKNNSKRNLYAFPPPVESGRRGMWGSGTRSSHYPPNSPGRPSPGIRREPWYLV